MINLTPNYQHVLPKHWIYNLPACPLSGHALQATNPNHRLTNPVVLHHVIYEHDALVTLFKLLYIEKKPLKEVYAQMELAIDSHDDDRMEWFLWGVEHAASWGLSTTISTIIPGGFIFRTIISGIVNKGINSLLNHVDGGAPSTKVRQQTADWKIKHWLKQHAMDYDPSIHKPIIAPEPIFKHAELPQKFEHATQATIENFQDAPADYYATVFQRAWRNKKGIAQPIVAFHSIKIFEASEKTYQCRLANQQVTKLQFSANAKKLLIVGKTGRELTYNCFNPMKDKVTILYHNHLRHYLGYCINYHTLFERDFTNPSRCFTIKDGKKKLPGDTIGNRHIYSQCAISRSSRYACIFDRASSDIILFKIDPTQQTLTYQRHKEWQHKNAVNAIKFNANETLMLLFTQCQEKNITLVEIYDPIQHKIIHSINLTEQYPWLTHTYINDRASGPHNIDIEFVAYEPNMISVFIKGELKFYNVTTKRWLPPILLPANLQLQNVYALTQYHLIAFVGGVVYYIDCWLGDMETIFKPEQGDIMTNKPVLTVDPVNKCIAVGMSNQIKVARFNFDEYN